MGAFRHANETVSGHGAIAVTPSDVTIFQTCRSIYVGVAGNITVRMADFQQSQQARDDNVLFSNVPVGIFPIQVDKVYATGTAATNIVALY